MQFNTPTTKDEMLTILNDLFYHYRIMREEFEPVDLEPLNLGRLEFVMPTDSEMENMALRAVSAKQEREISEYKQDLEDKINQLRIKKITFFNLHSFFVAPHLYRCVSHLCGIPSL